MKILPDEIPADAAPLEGSEHFVHNAITYKNREVEEGKNMFVSLLTGAHYVGRIEWVDENHFTVGSSDPIPDVLIESAREV